MQIETFGHSDRYSIEQIVSLHFTPDADLYLKSEYDDIEKTVKTFAVYKEQCSEAEYRADIADKTEFKNSVKKSAFIALSEIDASKTPWGILTGIRPTKFFRELLNKNSEKEARRILTEDFWVSEKKAKLCSETTAKSLELLNGFKKNEVCFYIGIPFCPTRCSYCSFITEAFGVYKKYIPEYEAALEKEIAAMADIIREKGLNVKALYIGGGTPPTLGEELLFKLMEKTRKALSVNEEVEFTVEAGRPDVMSNSLLEMLSKENVTRLCINPQTMNEETLRKIGRMHTAKDVAEAFERARKYGFLNINSDLIAGLPGENYEMFLHTLDEIKKLEPEELTVHTMYLKRASSLSGKDFVADAASVSDMVDAAYDFAAANGYKPYYMYKQRNTLGNLENVGYAKAGYESYYNAAVMEETSTVIAVGAGASTKLVDDNIKRIYNTKDVLLYIKNIDEIIKNKSEEMKKHSI